MKKSSLGRRSSTMSQYLSGGGGRIFQSEKTNNDKTNSRVEVGKKSFIPKPTQRSSSIDRDNSASSLRREVSTLNTGPASTMKRSKSYLSFDMGYGGVTSTPCRTPQRNHTMMSQFSSSTMSLKTPCTTDKRGRASSVGANKKCDVRPVNEKSFQLEAQRKIEEYFSSQLECAGILEKGSMKPMTTSMFVDMVNHLAQRLNPHTIISTQNVTERVPAIGKSLGYMGKMERSWLISVNTQHAWPHVVAFLAWLVDKVNMVMEIPELWQSMYPDMNMPGMAMEDDASGQHEQASEMDEPNFRILTPHLLKAFECSAQKDGERKCREEMGRFLVDNRDELGINQQEIDALEQECRELDEKVKDPENVAVQENYDAIDKRVRQLSSEFKLICEEVDSMIDSINHIKMKREETVERMEEVRQTIDQQQQEVARLNAVVESQVLSVDDRDVLQSLKADLKRKMACQMQAHSEYAKIVYEQDINIVNIRQKIDSLRVTYNTQVSKYVGVWESLKLIALDTNPLHQGAEEELAAIDENLRSLRTKLQQDMQNAEDELRLLTEEATKFKEQKNSISKELKDEMEQREIIQQEVSEKKSSLMMAKDNYDAKIRDLEAELISLRDSAPDVEGMKLELAAIKLDFEELRKKRNEKASEYKKWLEERYANKEELAADLKEIMRDAFEKLDMLRQKVKNIQNEVKSVTKC